MEQIRPYTSSEQHIQHLENIVRDSLDALELCAFFEDTQSPLNNFKTREEIFHNAVAGIEKIVPILFYGVYLLDDQGLDLNLFLCRPETYQDYVQKNLEYSIDNGTVALAMRENRTVVTSSNDYSYDILLHAMNTNKKTHGLFVCFLKKHTTVINVLNSILLTVVMRSTAYAFENFELYTKVDQQNEKLNQVIGQLKKEMDQKEKIEQELRRSEIVYRNVFENTGNPTIILDKNGLIILSNTQFIAFSKYKREDLINKKNLQEFIPKEEDWNTLKDMFSNTSISLQERGQEFIFYDRENKKSFVLLHVYPLGIDGNYIVSFSDITKIKKAEKKLNFQAYHDTLTRLPNRAFLEDRLNQAIKKSYLEPDFNYALLFIDIDRLKIINDTMGHAAGDELIKKTAEKLGRCVRDVDTVSRFGGDEFVILLEGLNQVQDCDLVVQRIYNEFVQPINIQEKEQIVTLSMGIYIGTNELLPSEKVIQAADIAMYRAKSQGRNSLVYYSEQEGSEQEIKLELEGELSKAIHKEEIFLHYQPIINLTNNQIYGLEALVRWKHPKLGFISPGKFIPIAEETGLIVPLGKKIFQLAFAQFRNWLDKYPWIENIFLCLNLSVKQLINSDILEDIMIMAKHTGMPLENLHLEITESVFIEDDGYACQLIQELKELGISISIDDFGTGYSSLRYLDRFSIDIIKIDKELIQKIDLQETSLHIIESMMSLSKKLYLNVVAEGIEKASQLECLKKLQCHLGQGFLFAKPMSSEKIEQLIRNNN